MADEGLYVVVSQEMLEEGEQVRVMFKVCKVLGTETAEVKFD
jgi:hypothetical protein